jgi:hypothetical protein
MIHPDYALGVRVRVTVMMSKIHVDMIDPHGWRHHYKHPSPHTIKANTDSNNPPTNQHIIPGQTNTPTS